MDIRKNRNSNFKEIAIETKTKETNLKIYTKKEKSKETK